MLNIYQLEQRIEAQLTAAKIPGLALAIVQNQKIIYARGFGVTSVEDGGLPVTPQTLFRIGSITKPLTGTAVMQLVEAGKLDLDKPIKEYLPWFSLSEADSADRVTLRMLMTHTTGLPTNTKDFGLHDWVGLEAYIREEIPRYPLIAPPGKVYSYSNPGISIVGYIAEVVSGKPYAELMHQLIFEPLEMKRTTFDPMVAMTYPLAQAHQLSEEGKLSVEHRFADNVASYPAAFAISTVLDLANFAIMHMNQGCFQGKQILSAESVAQMHKPHADWYTTTNASYGLTLITQPYKGFRQVWHNGVISSFGSWFTCSPDAGVAVVVLFNRRTAEFCAEKVVNDIFDQLLDLPEEILTPDTMPDKSLWSLYEGSYLGKEVGLATIQIVDDQLMLNLNGKIIPLKALKNDLYSGRPLNSLEKVDVGFILESAAQTEYIMVNSSPCQRTE